MRLFLGLDLAPSTKMQIDHWRHKVLPEFPKVVPAANFHITLAFLGSVEPRQLENLILGIDNLQLPKVEIILDTLGFWSKPQILFLGTKTVTAELEALAKRLSGVARSCNIDVRQGEYRPHVTLVRKVKNNPPCALIDPSFECKFSMMHLFESVSGKQGVHYPIRHSWSLN
ncbi:RNA 2',3'-cyclic phosphodiesterase [Glaciecola sp. 1036]|uniref:RNA 2',3'-cyclic phosphodiesterase n=1 Tax=Alteromonadaceae TaxID=72275 RepID=UPI003CFC7396